MEKTKKLLIPKTDIVFQTLFGTKGNEKILEGLLSEILEKKVENVSIDGNQILPRDIPTDKLGILDLRANIGNDTLVNIEVQLMNPYNMPERILFYWAKLYGTQLKLGEDYKRLKKTISILIIDFELPELKNFNDAHTKWHLLEKRNTKTLVFKNIEIHIIEIPKWIKNKNKTKKGLGDWIEFLVNPESERLKVEVEKNKKLKEAYKKLEDISEDEKMRRLSELRLKFMFDQNNINSTRKEIDERIEKGKQEIKKGKREIEKGQKELEEGQKEIKQGQKELEEGQKELKEGQQELEEKEKNFIKKILKANLSIEEIKEITGYTTEKILKIKNQQQ